MKTRSDLSFNLLDPFFDRFSLEVDRFNGEDCSRTDNDESEHRRRMRRTKQDNAERLGLRPNGQLEGPFLAVCLIIASTSLLGLRSIASIDDSYEDISIAEPASVTSMSPLVSASFGAVPVEP